MTNYSDERIVELNIPTVGGKLTNKEKHYQDGDTRSRIVTVANELFFSMEYNKVTLGDIAKKAGVTKGGIYHYFDSKDDLLVESLIFTFDSMMANLNKELLEKVSFEEFLKKWFDFKGHLDDYSGMTDSGYNIIFQSMYLLMIAIRKSDKMTEKIRFIYLGAMSELEMLIVNAQNSGELRTDLKAKAIAHQLLSVVEGGILVAIILKDDDIESTGDMMFETIWQQIKA